MPTTAAVKIGTIAEKHLSFIVGKTTNNTRTIINGTPTNDSTEYNWICGEAITAGDAVTSPDSDGKVWKATTLTIDNKEAFAIAKETYAINILGTFIISKKFRCDDYDFVNNAIVWLVDDTPNITTDLPTFSAGHLIQQLGKSVSTTEFIINIEEPEHVI